MANSKKIVFHSNQLGLRGTEIALYDYAHFNELELNNQSIVVYNKNSENNALGVIEKFNKRFDTFGYSEFAEVDQIISRERADLFYKITNGKRDGMISKLVPTMVHAVFPRVQEDIHGASYAYVSDWLSDVFSDNQIPAVPHIMHLHDMGKGIQGDMRDELDIPEQATVFGWYGGSSSFNIDFVRERAIPESLSIRDDLYFIFMNTEAFMDHERVIFLPGSSNIETKIKFIKTSDAMLHARKLGESFGIACGEFSMQNKPIITYSRSRQRSHIEILNGNAFLYGNTKDLVKILTNFDKKALEDKCWDFYTDRFSPNAVMRKFDQHLIRPALANGVVNDPGIRFSIINKFNVWLNKMKIKIAHYIPF